MNTKIKTARIVGLLFIIATASSIVGTFGFLEPILRAPDFLIKVFSNENQLILGVLIDAINSVAVVVIAFMLFPIFKKHNETLALGYVGSRIIESVILIVGHISLLLLIPLSQEYVQAGAHSGSYSLSIGTLILAINDLIFLIGPGIAFSITALILNYLFYKSKLVPRFLSIWGFIGGILLLLADVLAIFGLSTSSTVFALLVLPIGLNEMVLALWLIVKGFNPLAIEPTSVETDN